MKTVQIGKVNFGEGKPKICIPIMGSTFVELEKEISKLSSLKKSIEEMGASL